MLQRLSEDRSDLLFLGSITIVTGYFIYSTAALERSDSASVPWVILIIMVASLVAIFVMKLYGDRIEARLGLGQDDGLMEMADDTDDAEMFEVDLRGVSKELGWIGAYIVSMLYVGFFTSTVVFITGYILVKETSPLKRRLAYVVIWNVGVLGILYVLFIELLRVSAIFRLGFLP